MDGTEALLLGAGEATGRAREVAARVREVADAARSLGLRVQAVEGTPWRSVAADVFRWRVAELAVALRRAADRVDAGADALTAHAAVAAGRVEHLENLLRSVEQAVESGVDDVARRARRALDDALPRAGRWG